MVNCIHFADSNITSTPITFVKMECCLIWNIPLLVTLFIQPTQIEYVTHGQEVFYALCREPGGKQWVVGTPYGTTHRLHIVLSWLLSIQFYSVII